MTDRRGGCEEVVNAGGGEPGSVLGGRRKRVRNCEWVLVRATVETAFWVRRERERVDEGGGVGHCVEVTRNTLVRSVSR